MLAPFECLCGNFILPEPASYVFFYAIFNLRNLLYIILYQQIIINHAIIYVQFGGHDGMDGTGVTSLVPSAALAFQTFAVVTDVQHNLLRAHVFPDQIQHRQLRHFPDDLLSLLKIIGTLQDLPGRNTAVDGIV